MGNQCNVCIDQAKDYPVTSVGLSQAEVTSQILNIRTEIFSFPSVPQIIQQKIDKFAKKSHDEVGAQPAENSDHKSKDKNAKKMWKIDRPYNVIYRNEEANSESLPQGLVTVYKLKQNSEDFAGFFKGKINHKGHIQLKNSLTIFPNGSYLIGKSATEAQYTNQTTKLNYEGKWERESPHGQGVETTSKGRYEGNFLNGKKCGRGVYTWPDGSVYNGQFDGGTAHGYGEFTDNTDHYKYEGQYDHGVKSGKGKWRSQVQSTFYEGQFKHGMRNGKGALSLSNDINYKGMFEDDFPHGVGVLTQHDGTSIKGIWEKGQFQAYLLDKPNIKP